MCFTIVAYVFVPFILEVLVRWFQDILTLNYFLILFAITVVNFVPFISFPKYSKLWIWWYFIIFYVATFVDVCHIYFFVGEIDLLSMKAVFETNVPESLEFVTNFASVKTVTLLCVLILCSVFLLHKALSVKIRKKGIKILFPIFIIGMLASCFIHDKYKPTFVRMVRSYVYYIQQKDYFLKCIEQRKIFSYGKIKNLLNTDENQTYVIVIGESANREHHSLYGYHRTTNPELEKIKQNLFVFDNVTSAHCQTLEVLQEALTFDKFAYGDVISFFKSVGFKTFWLSNQFNGGRWDNIISIIGNQADVCFFVNQRNSKKMHGKCFDELLIEPFLEALNDVAPKKVIFVHLLGSHSIYKNRYPQKYNVFKDSSNRNRKIISEYDNSILYTDNILSKFITCLNTKNEISYLLYFSDHGEDVRDTPDCCFYHSPSISSAPMFSVPFIVWISNKYLSRNLEFVKGWDTHKRYKTNKLIHSILRLSQLQNSKIKIECSIFN